MIEHKVYRNISTPIKIMGLELVDLGVLIVCFLIVFNVSDRLLLNLAVLFGLGFVLRYLKKDKPVGFAIDLILFLSSSPYRHVGLNDPLPRYPGGAKLGAGHDPN